MKKVLKKAFRWDSRPWNPGKTVTPEDAARAMTGDEKSGAEAARRRMLERHGLTGKKSTSAAQARARMIERQTERQK